MPSHSLPRRRILLVDDEESVLLGLQMAFEDLDWHLEVSSCAHIALERHRAAPFDLIITDKNLPDMDGLALIREIRRTDANTRLLMITGYGSLDSAIESANLGIDAYIQKPFRNVYDVVEIAKKTLAQTRPNAAARLAVSSSVAPTPTTTANSGPVAAKKPYTALIATAEADVRTTLEGILREFEFEVISSKTSSELLDELSSWSPVLLLIHGAMDVVELVSRVRDVSPNLAIAVLCESLDVSTTRQLIGMNVSAIFNGGIRANDLEARLEMLLRSVRCLEPIDEHA